jgi:hypothetical protein
VPGVSIGGRRGDICAQLLGIATKLKKRSLYFLSG